jgi:hypothetical protein
MATNYTIQIDDAYAVPAGTLTKQQYVNFVMNKAAESYKNQYGTTTFDAGIQAACDAYNASVPVEPVVEETPAPVVEETPPAE